jgi:putative endonuclease
MPPSHKSYWVYILTNKPHGTLYIGMTNSLERRVWQHKTKAAEGFTKCYGLDRLVYFEDFRDVTNSIKREKELKGWLRRKKIELIQKENPLWRDLSDGWFDAQLDSSLSLRMTKQHCLTSASIHAIRGKKTRSQI